MSHIAQVGESSQSAPDNRSTSFQAVQGEREHYSGEVLLVSAYAVAWVVLFAWVVMAWRKQGALDVRLRDLEREIEKATAREAKRP